MNATPHPDTERLTAYVLGKLSWSEVEQVEVHLGSCADCRSQVGALEGRDDSFVTCLRGVFAEPYDDSALEKVLAGACALLPTNAGQGGTTPVAVVAGHELRGELARGGLGVVYLAYHPLLRDLRAIKRPQLREGINADLLLARFRREVQAVGGLRHEHVIRAHDAGADDEGPYLVMEYLDGEPLSRLGTRHRQLPVPEACELVRQAALGLQAAHERGLVHRDVKPSNLMLARGHGGARVVVIDWGLVKLPAREDLPAEDQPTPAGVALGTADYIAPEQTRDSGSVDSRADVYSLGATLYFLLAGKPPFGDRPGWQKFKAHQNEAFPPLDRPRGDVPRAVLAVLHRMVEKEPARRFTTPGEVGAALQPFCCDPSRLLALLDPGNAGTKPPPPLPTPSWRRRWLLAGAAAALGIAVLLGWVLRGKTSDSRRATREGGVPATQPAAPQSMNTRHSGSCSSLAFLPDGLHAVSESGGAEVCVWDLQSCSLKQSWLYAFEQPFQDLSGVLAVSPEGSLLAVAGINPATRDLFFPRLFDARTGKPIGKDYPIDRLGRALAFSPDGSRLAMVELPGLWGFAELVGQKPMLDIREIQTGKRKRLPLAAPVNSIAFSSDGTLLVTGSDDRDVLVWSLAENRRTRLLAGHTGAVSQVTFSADGKRIFSASNADGTLRVWNNDPESTDAGKEVRQIQIGVSKMLCAAFWPGGRALTGHADGRVVLWDLDSGKEQQQLPHKDTEVTAVALSPDGSRALAARSDRLVYLYPLPPPGARP
jgi:serine/threonine protein kinase